jgi:hypothetical protein
VKGDRSARSEFAAVVEGDAGDISGSSETAKVVLDAPVDDLEEEEENSEGGLEDDLEEEQPEVATSSDPLPDGLVRRGKDLSMKREGS